MRQIIFLMPFFLVGCINEETLNKSVEVKECFQITSSANGTVPNSPILLDKCTGETWILLRNTEPLRKGQQTPDYVWGWYRVERWSVENAVSGQ